MTQELGKYTLVRPLAQGGMAEVWLAKYAGPGGFEKNAVIKRILPHLTANADFVQMFLDEARIAARLSHPNIVQVFDFGEEQGSYFLCMEQLVGEDVATLIRLADKKKRHLPAAVSALILSAACDALHYAHTLTDDDGQPLNVVHRDVSPSNIFVTYQGAVKVLDFGIAKAENKLSQTQGGVLKGKFVYMSPEQIRGKPLDGRSDVFALGAVLAEMLTGSRLFFRENELGILAAITEDPIPSMRALAPDAPEELDAIVQRALARDREQRYPDAHAMRHALEEYVASTTTTPGATLLQNFMRELVGEEAIREKSRPLTGGALKAPGGPIPRQPSARPPGGPLGRQPSGRPPSGGNVAKPPSGGNLARPPSGGNLARPPSGPKNQPAPVEPDGESTAPIPITPEDVCATLPPLAAHAGATLVTEPLDAAAAQEPAEEEPPPEALLNAQTRISAGLGAEADPQVAVETVIGSRPVAVEDTGPLVIQGQERRGLMAFLMLAGTLLVAGGTWGALTLFAQPDSTAAAPPEPISIPPLPALPEQPAKLPEPPKPPEDKPVAATPEPAKPAPPEPAKPEKPVAAAEPEKPMPEKPAEPAKPVAVAAPAKPVAVAAPAKPVPDEPRPTKPAEPARPKPEPVAAKQPKQPTPVTAKAPDKTEKPVKVAQTPAPAPEPAKEPAGAPAKLDVNCIPWCHIYVDGKDTGKNSPAFGLDVTAGPHKIKVVNPPTGLVQERDVNCVAGQSTKVVVRFE